MTNLDVLEINFNNIKNDYKNGNVDLFIAKIELESIILKLNKIINEQKNFGFVDVKAIDLITAAIGLLDKIKHDIDIQEKEEYFISNLD